MTPLIEFKDVNPDMIEEPIELFKYLCKESIDHLHEHTKIKHCSKISNQIDKGITEYEMLSYCGSILLMDLYPLA